MAWKLAIMMAINEWFHRKRIWFDSNSFIFIEFWWIYSGLHLGKLRRLHIWKAFFFRWKLIFQPPIWQGLPKKILHGAALTSSTPGEPQAFGRILDTNLWSLRIPKVSQKNAKNDSSLQPLSHHCSGDFIFDVHSKTKIWSPLPNGMYRKWPSSYRCWLITLSYLISLVRHFTISTINPRYISYIPTETRSNWWCPSCMGKILGATHRSRVLHWLLAAGCLRVWEVPHHFTLW